MTNEMQYTVYKVIHSEKQTNLKTPTLHLGCLESELAWTSCVLFV